MRPITALLAGVFVYLVLIVLFWIIAYQVVTRLEHRSQWCESCPYLLSASSSGSLRTVWRSQTFWKSVDGIGRWYYLLAVRSPRSAVREPAVRGPGTRGPWSAARIP